jgi:type IV secretory pathway protease TraF
LPARKPLAADPSGRPLKPYPPGTYRVNVSEVWLMNPYDLSYDSRYLGPIPLRNVRGEAKQVLTW